MDIPAETCEGCLGAGRPNTDIASEYITADKPEVTATFTSQEVTTSFPTENNQTAPAHTIYVSSSYLNIRFPAVGLTMVRSGALIMLGQ